MENNQSEKGGAKKFFISKIFKWLLILLLEGISVIVFMVIVKSGPEFFKEASFWIYFGICFLFSITTIMGINNSIKKHQDKGEPGVIRIMSQRQHYEESLEKWSSRMGIMIALSMVLAPVVAPINIGTLIHRVICFALK